MSELVSLVSGSQLDASIGSGTVLVDFWATWCGPCKAQSPILQRVAEKVGAAVQILKVNVEESQDSVTKFNVRSVPTLILFKNGIERQRWVGLQPENVLIGAIGSLQV